MVVVNMSLEEYAQGYRKVNWPRINQCPICGARTKLQNHGWYRRNALPSKEKALVVMIRRLLCPVCHKTVSLMPSILLPHFQYTLGFIMTSLTAKTSAYRELLRFHWKRFLRNINVVQAFFRDIDPNMAIPAVLNEKAMKLLAKIRSLGPELFSVLFLKRFHRCFMAA
ncbi:MAG: DUF6431 domain-containing protein [Bacillota bacterium]